MGKSKKKLHKASTESPTGLPSVRDIEKEEADLGVKEAAADPVPSVIENIFEKFQSASVEDKECGCYILANLAEQKEAIGSLLQHDVVKVAASLLFDPSDRVRHAAAGALRNLSVCGDEMCEGLMQCDVMTPLVALLNHQYSCGWEPAKPANGKIDSIAETFIEAVHLLANMCESSGSAVRIFNQEGLVTLLMPCLDVATYNFRIAIAVGQCLHSVSEDNEKVWDSLKIQCNFEQLQKLVTPSVIGAAPILLRNLSSGIILNMYAENLEQCSPLLLTSIMTGLSQTLSTNLQPFLIAVIDKMIKTYEDDNDEGTDASRDSLVWLVQSKQVALEVLTNLCCGIDEKEDGWEDMDSSDASEEMQNTSDVIMGDCTHKEKCLISIPQEVHEAIVSLRILPQIVSHLDLYPDDVDARLQSPAGEQFSQSLGTLRCRALLCVNNMINCLGLEEMGGSDYLYDVWLIVAKLAFKEVSKDTFDTRLVESATGAMRSVMQRLAEAQCKRFELLVPNDVQMICDLLHKCNDTNTCVNVVHILGTLGWLMGNVCSSNSQAPELIRIIGQFLLDVCYKDVELWVEAEALDALFDVFAEDHLDAIAAEILLVERLRGLLPRLKHKIKSQRGNLGDHSAIIQTTKTNFDRFLKYKSNRFPKV